MDSVDREDEEFRAMERKMAEEMGLRNVSMVKCDCGDSYPTNSYGAGFMDASGGVCENCAMVEDDMGRSDGSTAKYYELPVGALELQDLISYRNMNAQDGEIFRAIYRKGLASHSDALRDAKKVLFYAQAEVERLERYGS